MTASPNIWRPSSAGSPSDGDGRPAFLPRPGCCAGGGTDREDADDGIFDGLHRGDGRALPSTGPGRVLWCSSCTGSAATGRTGPPRSKRCATASMPSPGTRAVTATRTTTKARSISGISRARTRSGCSTASRAGRAHLVGLSMGGRIAQDFHARFPDRVATLVLCATRADFRESMTPEQRAEFIRLRQAPLKAGKEPRDIADALVESLVAPRRRRPGAPAAPGEHRRAPQGVLPEKPSRPRSPSTGPPKSTGSEFRRSSSTASMTG